MKYISTRGKSLPINFKECLINGLAPDGGLYIPEKWPKFSKQTIIDMKNLSYEELAKKIILPFIGDTFSEFELNNIIYKAYDNFEKKEKCLLKKINDKHYLLELFHGPTFAFKDFAMQIISQMFELTLSNNENNINIIGATSGDTGSAAVEAFKNKKNVNLFILFPKGRISDIQRRQMTTSFSKNIKPIMIDGDFDDCQNIVKLIFEDISFKERMKISGINSINWARILAQVVYYFYSSFKVSSNEEKISFCVPSGNFGNIFAGFVAKKLGLSIEYLITASNKNDILNRVVKTGVYEKGKVHKTISPSMDIQISSNFERLLFELFDRNHETTEKLMNDLKKNGKFQIENDILQKLKVHFKSGVASEKETMKTLKNTFVKLNELVCPHTAVGLKVSEEYLKDLSVNTKLITLATAHPAKFFVAVSESTGKTPKFPQRIKDIMDKEESYFEMNNSVDDIKKFIIERG